MRLLGKPLRWLCLLGFIAFQIFFLVHGATLLRDSTGEMGGIFICDSPDDPEMIQCTGYDDVSTCGAEIQCIRSSCGRPLFPRISVSFAGSSNPFDANAATTTKSFVTILALLYSLVPYLLIVCFSINFLAVGSVVPLTRLGYIFFEALVNEAMLKNIIQQHRPTGSCLYFHSFGMPSGHAVISIGLLTSIMLELFLYHPSLFENNQPESCDVERGPPSDVEYVFQWGYGWHKEFASTENSGLEATALPRDDKEEDGENSEEVASLRLPSDFILEPETSLIPFQQQGSHLSKWSHHGYALMWTALLVPVPWSRVHLHDHSLVQILVGSVVGMILGNIWYFIIVRGRLFCSGCRAGTRYLVDSRVGKLIELNVSV